MHRDFPSDRGGKPGFVGDGIFDAFGNLALDPRRRLLFIDFSVGPKLGVFVGAERPSLRSIAANFYSWSNFKVKYILECILQMCSSFRRRLKTLSSAAPRKVLVHGNPEEGFSAACFCRRLQKRTGQTFIPIFVTMN